MTAGRHPYQPTDEDRAKVKRLASFKLPHAVIASLITNRQTGKPVGVDALREACADELGLGFVELYTTVADRYALRLTGAKAEVDKHGNIVRAEITASERAQERFLDTFGPEYGWSGADDPLGDIDLTKVTPDELAFLKAIMLRARKPRPDA